MIRVQHCQCQNLKKVALHHIAHLAQSVNEGATASESSFFVLRHNDLLNVLELKSMPRRGCTIFRKSGRCLFMKKDNQW